MGNAPGRLRNTTSKRTSSRSCHSSCRSQGQVSQHVSSETRARSFSVEGTPGQSSGNSIVLTSKRVSGLAALRCFTREMSWLWPSDLMAEFMPSADMVGALNLNRKQSAVTLIRIKTRSRLSKFNQTAYRQQKGLISAQDCGICCLR